MSDVIVVGGGAAGMMAAGKAAEIGHKVTVLERNERTGRKLMITGKGRCNVTNDRSDISELISAVPVNGKFLYGAFSRFMPSDTMAFFEGLGVPLKTERGKRVFPVSDKASDIVDALYKYAVKSGARFINARAKELIIENGSVKGVETFDGDRFFADSVIIATGGMSYKATGSTGDGYEMAKKAGHTVTELKPSLVPLNAHEGFCSDLMGLSLRNVSIKVVDTETGKTVYTDFGEMLFTHFGVSGPMILSASSYMRDMKKKRYVIYIDLKPALSEEQLDLRLLRDFSEVTNKNFINSLNSLLPKKLVPVVVKLSGISPSKKTNQITKEERKKFVSLLKNIKITVTGFRPIEEAIITSGGVSVSEIDPKTMASKLVKNLYFAGEIIDADAVTGGYNLQIAFSTAVLAANSIQ
ncbi:MAG: NAD(P)/FAD-dependent oxidoreductase [Clostridiales bacterium]|nr:NAD(P)/FAD-dependent oxidoreductase [Clostridiales bacterium]